MDLALATLSEQGYEVIPFELSAQEVQKSKDITAALLLNKMIGRLLKTLERNYEQPASCYKMTGTLFSLGSLSKGFLKGVLKMTGNHRIANSLGAFKTLSEEEMD